LRNLGILIDYLTKHFDFKIEIWEADKKRIVPPSIYDRENVEYSFVPSNETHLHRTKYFNLFAKTTSHKYIGYLDCDCIFEKRNLIACIEAVGSGYTLALPFDGNFINIDNTKTIDQFAEELKTSILKDAEPSFVIPRSVGGGVVVNKDGFLQVGGRERKHIWMGISDDIDRIHTVLTNGKKVFRSNGSIFHLDHFRVPVSADHIRKNVIEQIENYIKL